MTGPPLTVYRLSFTALGEVTCLALPPAVTLSDLVRLQPVLDAVHLLAQDGDHDQVSGVAQDPPPTS